MSPAEPYTLKRNYSPVDTRLLERHLPVERLGPDTWLDHPSDRVYSTDQILSTYAHRLPERLRKNRNMPAALQAALECVNVHLIEAQRLLHLDEFDDFRRPHQRRITPSSVVDKDASDLAERIGHLLQEYAHESQNLDQTFPKRILDIPYGTVSEEAKIRADLEDLARKRDDLVSVGLLGSTITDPIRPSDNFRQENIRRILDIYVEDTRQKLSKFDEIHDKIRLFKQILDGRLSFKKIEIDQQYGIRAIDTDNHRPIPLANLSSGEQHELVLIYELLFTVQEGSIILIDEPELSLHVVWQKNFITDVAEIQKLKKLRVIIATHSPQIIQGRWSLVTELEAPPHHEQHQGRH